MPAAPPDLSCLAVLGAGGRIGRLLRPIWGAAPAWHARSDGPPAPAVAGRGVVVCLAGVTSGDAAALAGNTDAALDALEAARAAGAARVLLMSSSAVYGRAEGPLTEDRPAIPANAYGAAKHDMERGVAAWRAAHPDGPEAVCLRLGNVAGADALLGRLGATPPRLDIFPDGRGPRRNYVGPVTLARTLAALAAHPGPLPPVLNLGSPGLVDMTDLLRAAGRDWDAVPASDAALPEVALDTSRLAGIVPLGPKTAAPATLVAEWREATA
ncbi:NAD-dependent epimerase/dehydratase family protein [uncultured Jannaschia sp.]|uniref:NAD-dependent epimerase/dehydratase family protein n=1 Tax=uncultured Jannaschia sp. TaxID=293347 RepID=UPI0026186554|nr:NAD-dependent epimerase/dehydratase family protein [uncultured Jannaschia sp.]